MWLACFRDYSEILAPGERGVVMVLAADRRQAKVIFRYVRAFLTGVPMLARKIVRETSEEIDLDSGISISIHTSSYRSVRGYTIVAALCDEVAFWRDDSSSNPDTEIIQALRPGMATVPGALLIGELPVLAPRRSLGCLAEALRPGRRFSLRVAGRHAGNDSDGPAGVHRPRL